VSTVRTISGKPHAQSELHVGTPETRKQNTAWAVLIKTSLTRLLDSQLRSFDSMDDTQETAIALVCTMPGTAMPLILSACSACEIGRSLPEDRKQ